MTVAFINKTLQLLAAALIGLAFVGSSITAQAASFPDKTVRIIVGFPPGGGIDTLARTIAPLLSTDLGQPVIVENKPGASGVIGMNAAAKSSPDGHTIFLGTTGNISINPIFIPNLPFSVTTDFKPLMQVASVPFLIYAHPSFPPNNLRELVDYAKANPGKFNFYSSGKGGLPHLTGELLNSLAHINTVHVPYKGSAPGMNDLLGGHVQLGYDAVSIGLPHVKTGRLKALAVTGTEALSFLPDVAPANKTVPGLVAVNWYGMLVPAQTPDSAIAILNKAITKALNTPEVKSVLSRQGIYSNPTDPKSFGAFIDSEALKWGNVVKSAKIKK